VCLSAILRPQFLFDFQEILHRGSGPEKGAKKRKNTKLLKIAGCGYLNVV